MAFFSQPKDALGAEGLPSWTWPGGRPWLLSGASFLHCRHQPGLSRGAEGNLLTRPGPRKRGRVPRPP